MKRTKFVKINKNDITGNYKININLTGVSAYRWSCGCTVTQPHSHLVNGESCICEKGLGNILV